MVTTFKRGWINPVWLPILLVVSRTEKNNNFSSSPFAPENFVSRHRFGRPVSRQPAHFPPSRRIWYALQLHTTVMPPFPRHIQSRCSLFFLFLGGNKTMMCNTRMNTPKNLAMSGALQQAPYRTTYHMMLLRILGAWRKSPNNRIISYQRRPPPANRM